MRLAILGAVAVVALAGDVCRADWPPKPFRNTPVDPGTWIPRPRPADPSHLPVEPDPPPRGPTGRWETHGSYFQHRGNGMWIEYDGGGRPMNRFRQVNRTDQYIYLIDDNRNMDLVLTRTEGLVKQPDGQWVRWITAAGTSAGRFR